MDFESYSEHLQQPPPLPPAKNSNSGTANTFLSQPPPPAATTSVYNFYAYPYYAPPPVHAPPPPPLPPTTTTQKMNTCLDQPPPPADEQTTMYNAKTLYSKPPPALPTIPSHNTPTHIPPPLAPAPLLNEASTSQAAYGHGYNYTYNYYDNYYNYDYGRYYATQAEPPPRYSYSGGTDRSGYYKKYAPPNRGGMQHARYAEGRNTRYEQPSTHRDEKQGTSYSAFRRSYRERDREQSSEVTANKSKPETERERLLKTWRSNFCETPEDIAKKLADLAQVDAAKGEVWIRSSPSDLFYRRTDKVNEVIATPRLEAMCKLFEEELVQRGERVRAKLPAYEPPPRKPQRRLCKHKLEACSSSDSDSEHAVDELKIEQDYCMEELSRKLQHPYRIHSDLWHNDPGEMNDGPLCRCSAKSKRIGIRHGIYPGEDVYEKCEPHSNNASRLHHYTISISPPTNFLTKTPTIIKHDEHEFLFEGFSLLSHMPLVDLPTCKVIRFNIEYTIIYTEEKIPEHFTIRELDLFSEYDLNFPG